MHIETKAHNLVNLEGPALIDAIKKDFELDIQNPEKIIHGYSSQVYKASMEGQSVFIRINKSAQSFETEIFGYDALRKIGISVPELISYQSQPMTIGQPTMIIGAARGVAAGEANLSPGQEEVIYKKIGAVMKKIHSIRLEGFGSLQTSRASLRGEFKNWKDYGI